MLDSHKGFLVQLYSSWVFITKCVCIKYGIHLKPQYVQPQHQVACYLKLTTGMPGRTSNSCNLVMQVHYTRWRPKYYSFITRIACSALYTANLKLQPPHIYSIRPTDGANCIYPLHTLRMWIHTVAPSVLRIEANYLFESNNYCIKFL